MMKKAFYFMLKALFVLKSFNFCLIFLITKKKRLDQKNKANFKTCDVTPWLKTIAIQIFPNISRSKANQTATWPVN